MCVFVCWKGRERKKLILNRPQPVEFQMRISKAVLGGHPRHAIVAIVKSPLKETEGESDSLQDTLSMRKRDVKYPQKRTEARLPEEASSVSHYSDRKGNFRGRRCCPTSAITFHAHELAASDCSERPSAYLDWLHLQKRSVKRR